MGMTAVDNYYSKVVSILLDYREYKQRLRILDTKLKSKLDIKAFDYSGVNVQTSGLFDSTLEAVLDRLESDEAKEYNEKLELVNNIEIAVAGLDPVESFVIERKYLKGRTMPDAYIYNHPKFMFGKTKYYEIKDEAVAKIARILGFL